MRALIFAAGRGERMRPLTEHTPKPLLPVGGKPLIVWHLERLAASGIRDVVVNTAHLADQFPCVLGNGSAWGLNIEFVVEGSEPLETGGGMLNALPRLGDGPFLVINGDVYCDFALGDFCARPFDLAHLLMVPPPAFATAGDFMLDAQGKLHDTGEPRLTYAGIGLYRPQLLDGWQAVIGNLPEPDRDPPRFRIVPLLRHAMRQGRISGELHRGTWTDVGTPQRLQELDTRLRAG